MTDEESMVAAAERALEAYSALGEAFNSLGTLTLNASAGLEETGSLSRVALAQVIRAGAQVEIEAKDFTEAWANLDRAVYRHEEALRRKGAVARILGPIPEGGFPI